jgi:tetratricopeptide (TPR) repeat protein
VWEAVATKTVAITWILGLNGLHHERDEGSRWDRASDSMLKSCLPERLFFMSDIDTRQKAEEHYYAALDLMADGKLEEAVAAYHRALAADPDFTEAMHGLARALQDLQRYDEAIAVAQKISELDPDDVLAHTSLSVLYQKKGMIPEAEAEGAKARVLGWKQQLKKG